MKNFVILLGLFFTFTVVNAEHEMITNFTRSYKACNESMKPDNKTMQLLESNTDFANAEANCFRACVLKKLNILQDAKANFENLEKFLNSGAENPESVKRMLGLLKTDCQKNAEQTNDECAVAGSYTKCFLEVQAKMAADARKPAN